MARLSLIYWYLASLGNKNICSLTAIYKDWVNSLSRGCFSFLLPNTSIIVLCPGFHDYKESLCHFQRKSKATFRKFKSILSVYLGDMDYNKLCINLYHSMYEYVTLRQCCGNHRRDKEHCSVTRSSFLHTSCPLLSQCRTLTTECTGAWVFHAIFLTTQAVMTLPGIVRSINWGSWSRLKRVLRSSFSHGSVSFNGCLMDARLIRILPTPRVIRGVCRIKISSFFSLTQTTQILPLPATRTLASTACQQVS